MVVGERLRDAAEVERAQRFHDEPARLAHAGGLAHEPGEPSRALGGHLVGRCSGGDDLRLGHQLVAVAVVGVGVSVDQLVEPARGHGLRTAHAGEHRTRQFEIEQGVHQQALVAVHDEPRVAPTPAAIRLNPRVGSRPHIVETVAEGSNPQRHVYFPSCDRLAKRRNRVSPGDRATPESDCLSCFRHADLVRFRDGHKPSSPVAPRTLQGDRPERRMQHRRSDGNPVFGAPLRRVVRPVSTAPASPIKLGSCSWLDGSTTVASRTADPDRHSAEARNPMSLTRPRTSLFALATTLIAPLTAACSAPEQAGDPAPESAAPASTGAGPSAVVELIANGHVVFAIFSGAITREEDGLLAEAEELDLVFYSLESGPFDPLS